MALCVNVAIGSDHASSGIVDMTQEMRLACCCYKEQRLNPRVMPPEAGLAALNGPRHGGLTRLVRALALTVVVLGTAALGFWFQPGETKLPNLDEVGDERTDTGTDHVARRTIGAQARVPRRRRRTV